MNRESLSTFLRQSGGLTAAIFLGGLASYAVHKFAKEMPKADYGVFTTLLQLLNLVGIPVIGIQTTLAQQTAAAQTAGDRRQLAAALRTVLLGILVIWIATAAIVLVFQNQLLETLKISSPGTLWITMACALMALWLPVFSGVLQGRQDFLRLGGSIFSLSVVRLISIAVIVGFSAYVTSVMVGVWLGYFAALALVWWAARDALRNAGDEPFLWRPWVKRLVPFKFGAGAGILLMCADMILVQHYFKAEQTGFYAAAGMIGRALVFLVGPIVMVMFPKVARATATGEKSNVLFQTLGLTALIAGGAAGFCTLFPELPLRLVYDPSFLPIAAPLVPWFAWAMTPLVLAGVLNSHLLARGRYAVVPWLMIVAISYLVVLSVVAKRSSTLEPLTGFIRVVQTLGLFNLLFLVVALFFSWRERESTQSSAANSV